MFRRMDIQPDDIRRRAFEARVSINQLMKRAGLPNSTFWRWNTGRIDKPHPLTVARIVDALTEIEAERAA
jgi:predicted transcriptional regulator